MVGSRRTFDTDTLRAMLRMLQQIQAQPSVAGAMQAAADAVVAIAGFEIAVLNVRLPDGTFEAVAVAGSDEARDSLLGRNYPATVFEEVFARSEEWGKLRFVPHNVDLPDIHTYTPPVEVVDAPDAWHPDDMLFALLHSPEDELIGVMSVDLPADRRRPGPFQRDLLEVVAAQAGTAIHQARLTAQLRSSEEAFRQAFEAAGGGIGLVSLRDETLGRFLRVNQALCQLLGRTEEELFATSFLELHHPANEPWDRAMFLAQFAVTPIVRMERRYFHADCSTLWLDLTMSVIRNVDGEAEYAICHVTDVTSQRTRHAVLAHEASHDELTGLPNRRTLNDNLEKTIERGVRTGRAGALLFCDLDGFKRVNDRFGHAFGDEILKIVADRLRNTVRVGDAVIRFGGDEFLIAAPHTTVSDAELLAQRVRDAIATSIVTDGVVISLSVSVGVAEIPVDAAAEDVLHEADQAMYRDKLDRQVELTPLLSAP